MAKDMSLVRKFVVKHFGRHVKPLAAALTAMGLALVGLGTFSGLTPAAAAPSRGLGKAIGVFGGDQTYQAWFGFYDTDYGPSVCVSPSLQFGNYGSPTPVPDAPWTNDQNQTVSPSTLAEVAWILTQSDGTPDMAVAINTAVRYLMYPNGVNPLEIDNTATNTWDKVQSNMSFDVNGPAMSYLYGPNNPPTGYNVTVNFTQAQKDDVNNLLAEAASHTTFPTGGWDGQGGTVTWNPPAASSGGVVPVGSTLTATANFDSTLPNGTQFVMTVKDANGNVVATVPGTSSGGVVTISWPVAAGSPSYSATIAATQAIPLQFSYLAGNGGQDLFLLSASQDWAEPGGVTFQASFQPSIQSNISSDLSDSVHIGIQNSNTWPTDPSNNNAPFSMLFHAELVGPQDGKVVNTPGGNNAAAASAVQLAIGSLPVVYKAPDFTADHIGDYPLSVPAGIERSDRTRRSHSPHPFPPTGSRWYCDDMSADSAVITMGDRGRIVIPLEMREAAHLNAGDKLIAFRDERGINLMTRRALLEKIWAERVDPDVSLVDELIADRRAEALRDLEER